MLAVAWVVGFGLVAYLHFSSTSRLADLRVEHETAIADSANNAKLRAQGDSLAAQEAIIAQKMQLIQDIDAGRFTWSHIMDEISRALPSYIWLINMTEGAGEGGKPRVRMEGRAGNYYALGKYIEDLESSPFLRGVRLISSSRTIVEERVVLQFVLEMDYETPPPDAIQTVPLFAAQPGNGN